MRKLASRDEMRVLIVDDEKSSLDVLENYLETEGFYVLTASDGSQAIETIECEDLDVVLTDLHMPKADGIEVLKAAKRVNPDLYVVIITGYASLQTTLKAIKEGAYDYITKPFSLEEVGVVLKNVSEKVRLEKEKRLLIEDLRRAYMEVDILKESKTDLNTDTHEINRRMEEDHTRIATNLERLCTVPGHLLSLQYFQTKTRGNDQIIERLERLGKLKKEAVLTDKEFRLCKEKLLQDV